MGATSQLVNWLRSHNRSNHWNGWSDSAYRKQSYQHRLLLVQQHLSECLDNAPPGIIRIVSLFAGDGRDVLGVINTHPRRSDVLATFIEQSSPAVASGFRRAAELGLASATTFLNKDATEYEAVQGITPANIILLCGVWGHVPHDDRAQLIQAVTSLCTPNGRLIWTRGISKGIAKLEQIEGLFARTQWEKVQIRITPGNQWAVATYRFLGTPLPRPKSGQIFHFMTCAGTR
jgi:hypothetical protein